MNCGIVYLITNKVNGKKYVGQTSQGIERRWAEHCYASQTRKFLLHKAIQKYGKDNFEVAILASAPFPEALDDLERFHIAQHKSIVPNGYNLESGGSKYKTLSEDIKLKIKQSNTGFRCRQPNARRVVRLDLVTGIEVCYPNMGMAQADGYCRVSISKCCNGKEWSHAGSRWKFAPETEYPQPSLTRTPTGLKLLHLKSRSTRLSPKFSRGSKLKAVSLEGGPALFFSTAKAAEAAGFIKSSVYRCLAGKYSSYKGYKWEYAS
jgi:group I intron endonuclease